MISSYSSMFLRCLSHWPHHFGSASPWPCRGHGWHGAEAWRGAPRLEVCLQIAKYMGKRCENDGKMMENDVSMMEKWWGNDVKMMGKRCENDGKMMENDVKMVEWWKMKWCENAEKMMGKWWNMMWTWWKKWWYVRLGKMMWKMMRNMPKAEYEL